MFDMALVHQCAPHVSPQTMEAIIRTESGFNPLALHVNGDIRLAVAPRSAPEAIAWAGWLIKQGYSVDMGLMQINSNNLRPLAMTVADAFDPCQNLRAGAKILTENYAKAAQTEGLGTKALLQAISAYNTGNFRAGFRNGYVARVVSNSSRSRAIQPQNQNQDQEQVCWLSSCATVSMHQLVGWLTIASGGVIVVVIGCLFRAHHQAWERIGAGVRALRDRLCETLR